jgi:hypothetical protein
MFLGRTHYSASEVMQICELKRISSTLPLAQFAANLPSAIPNTSKFDPSFGPITPKIHRINFAPFSTIPSGLQSGSTSRPVTRPSSAVSVGHQNTEDFGYLISRGWHVLTDREPQDLRTAQAVPDKDDNRFIMIICRK